MKFVISLLILTIGLMTNGCHGLSCQATTLGITHDKECPGLFDDSDEVFCCGPLNDRECCSFELDVENFSTIIVVVAVSSIVIVILVCLCCCCLCPCCLLHQRRTRGVVHNPAQMQPIIVTTPNYVPLESGPYPPPQGHTTTPQPGYATAAPPPAGGNPPLYSEKQMAYNPNY